MSEITIPSPCVVLLIGASGSGKSTFARKHFLPTEILSSDTMRGWVSDDENAQEATSAAFETLHFVLKKRCEAHRTSVIDATNVQKEGRAQIQKIAKDHHMLVVAFVFDLPEQVCQERNAARPDRQFGPHVVRNHIRDLRRSYGNLRKERIRYVHTFKSIEEVDVAEIVRQPLLNDRRGESGPFDIVGDVHGCLPELVKLLGKLGYGTTQVYDPWKEGGKVWEVTPPEGRRLIFVGDLGDRGPDSVGVIKLVMRAVEQGKAICIPGNHDAKLVKYLQGKKVTASHGMQTTIDEMSGESDEFKAAAQEFLDGLVSHFVFDEGRLVVAHAGIPENMQGRASGAVREFCLYGDTTGETDEFGLPVRLNWAKQYRGRALVVFGHVAVPEPEWLNNTVDIDTGCVFGGSLTALRHPEKELVSVPAAEMYFEPARPLNAPKKDSDDGVLDIEDILGRRHIHTSLGAHVLLRHENAVAAVEVMSRFAADPRWVVYLPPTMSPSPTSDREGYLEYPTEAFQFYRAAGVERAVIETKHMGSRAVVVLCRDEETAEKRFRVANGETGAVLTRTGRRFFSDLKLESELLARVRTACDGSGLWDELGTSWVVLDCELMPWSAKAVQLLRDQYAAVGASAMAETSAVAEVWKKVAARGIDGTDEFLSSAERQVEAARRFRNAYRQYCWSVDSIDDYRLAPFHVLASESSVHIDRDHGWHMGWAAKLAKSGGPVVMETEWLTVELNDEASLEAACAWWEAKTSAGGEGAVVKPWTFLAKGSRGGYLQPAVKCRGPEYLRIIYGADYLAPENLSRLRKRGLGRKQTLAAKEFALGIEGLERFVRRESLSRVHECAFAVLALETEPVDPRL